MAEIDDRLRTDVEAWIQDDPDPEARRELEELLAEGNATELEDRFRGMLQFGTAGLRGVLGAGPNRMNRAVVLRATAGLCSWLKMQVPDAEERGVCIGFDGRHMSRQLAEDAASVVTGAGLRAHLFDQLVPTPLVAFSVLDRKAAGGIMITASHNPPEYNGYKVYWENGAQIIPPHDEGIAGCIAAVESVASIPRLAVDTTRRQGRILPLGDDVIRRYLDGVRALSIHPHVSGEIGIAYTALHGVGDRLVRAALSEAGFEHVHSVAAQAEPDGDFPTVSFPNPEEQGAMDLVLELARDKGADLVLANDPDADRLAVAVRDRDGSYVQLNGNEVGCLFAHYVLSEGSGEHRMVLSSVVSSPWLGAIAEAHGAHFEQTLTGFKWIANRAMELERDRGLSFVFGYEEALGYTIGTLVRDKDGVSAAMLMAEIAAWCRSRGRTLLDEREHMWRRYGLFLSKQVSTVLPGVEGAEKIAQTMADVRAEPPSEIAGREVIAVSDLLAGRRRPVNGPVEELGYPPSNVIILDVRGGHRVMLRPSGTEPKLKMYFDVCVDVKDNEPIDEALARGQELVEGLVDDFRRRTDV